MDRTTLMKQIQQYGFAIKELELYLDTHPGCRRALALFNSYVQKKKEAEQIYIREYGPIVSTQNGENEWNWVDSPWPWERGGNS